QFTERCVAGITANDAKCREYAEKTIALATALNPHIGYAKAAELVKESVATGASIVELLRRKKLLSEEQIAQVLDLEKMTEDRG
ncbi:MAG TPA: hypothetical protein VJV22_12255, partial [Acidobacteriaceae bacterium]|nr:hypothetical protein [Acidobacteriaceae bacterium]